VDEDEDEGAGVMIIGVVELSMSEPWRVVVVAATLLVVERPV